jgi:hypothetical protein
VLGKNPGIAADIKGHLAGKTIVAEPYSGQFGCPKRPKYGEKNRKRKNKSCEMSA